MARVIVLEPTALDLSSSLEFGSTQYISTHRFNLFNIDDILQRTQTVLKEIEYSPMEDFICLTGIAQKVAIFVGSVANRHPEFLMLIFDAREDSYKKRVFRNGNGHSN